MHVHGECQQESHTCWGVVFYAVNLSHLLQRRSQDGLIIVVKWHETLSGLMQGIFSELCSADGWFLGYTLFVVFFFHAALSGFMCNYQEFLKSRLGFFYVYQNPNRLCSLLVWYFKAKERSCTFTLSLHRRHWKGTTGMAVPFSHSIHFPYPSLPSTASSPCTLIC